MKGVYDRYKTYFNLTGDILPCKYCRDSYEQFIKDGYSKLTEESLENRGNLCKWAFNIHKRVNEKLGVDLSNIEVNSEGKMTEAGRAEATRLLKLEKSLIINI